MKGSTATGPSVGGTTKKNNYSMSVAQVNPTLVNEAPACLSFNGPLIAWVFRNCVRLASTASTQGVQIRPIKHDEEQRSVPSRVPQLSQALPVRQGRAISSPPRYRAVCRTAGQPEQRPRSGPGRAAVARCPCIAVSRDACPHCTSCLRPSASAQG
eukprot:scaffold2551_cov376-Prasinococcus_capsulatus_cf.AAC.7